MHTLEIRTFGSFSLRYGDAVISDSSSRSRRVWLLLACLLCHRGRTLSPKKLIGLLWGEDPSIINPENSLRITFHRARTLLNALWPNAGHDLILSQDNGYVWNDRFPVCIDFERFEQLSAGNASGEDQLLEDLLQALSLYEGRFLDKLSSEPWIIPMVTHFHNLYISTVLRTASLLADRDRHAEAAALCQRAAGMEAYHEPLYQLLIRELSAAGNQKAAAQVYEDLSRRLFDDFGIRPNEQTRSVYRSAVHSPGELLLPMDTVLEHLQESGAAAGAMCCDYDHFKVLCHLESRSMERSGNATHVALISVTSGTDIPLSRRTTNRIMEQLGEQIRLNLRRGDVFSRCSVCQYIIMLPQANYENSCMVCRRVLGAFSRKHPHVTARMNFMVQPLMPGIQVP